jgi:hypothetical protein
MRVVESEIMNKCFRYVPKNRVVEGVFKNSSKKDAFKIKS